VSLSGASAVVTDFGAPKAPIDPSSVQSTSFINNELESELAPSCVKPTLQTP
jgi:hypothetical protein